MARRYRIDYVETLTRRTGVEALVMDNECSDHVEAAAKEMVEAGNVFITPSRPWTTEARFGPAHILGVREGRDLQTLSNLQASHALWHLPWMVKYGERTGGEIAGIATLEGGAKIADNMAEGIAEAIVLLHNASIGYIN